MFFLLLSFISHRAIWNNRATIQFNRITCIHLPIGTKWLYVGTEKGNIYVVNIDTFSLSGYVINWNKAIDP